MSSLIVRIGEQSPETLYPGDIVGRLRTAALRVDDPRVSEAHAMVSLRNGEFQLLALRGVIAVNRQRVAEVVMVPGIRVRLAKDLYLEVLSIDLADQAMGVVLNELAPQLLLGSAAFIITGDEPGLLRRYDRDASAQLWSDGLGWRIQVKGQPPQPFESGTELVIDGVTVRAELVSLQRAGLDSTILGGRVHPPLRIVANYDTVHIHRKGLEPVAISGIGAKMISELVALGGPAAWEVVAEQIWRSNISPSKLRHRWDVSLGRLRSKLEQEGLRPNLLNSDGTGQIELLLLPGDEVEDNT
ncbi:MAG: hypothetical protein GWP91_08445 [Rhodobacterales bacterium]|nr:hypothetical protein [Rhodobacterales bacterium]